MKSLQMPPTIEPPAVRSSSVSPVEVASMFQGASRGLTYDVVAKPFHPAETTRAVNLACMRWQQRAQHSDRRPFVRVAAC